MLPGGTLGLIDDLLAVEQDGRECFLLSADGLRDVVRGRSDRRDHRLGRRRGIHGKDRLQRSRNVAQVVHQASFDGVNAVRQGAGGDKTQESGAVGPGARRRVQIAVLDRMGDGGGIDAAAGFGVGDGDLGRRAV